MGIIKSLINLLENRTPCNIKKAYDGVYYPATVIAKMEFCSPAEMIITDFSIYDEKKIVGFTIYTTSTMEDYYGVDIIEYLEDNEKDILRKPAIFKNVLVYAPQEGVWTWKSRK